MKTSVKENEAEA